MTMSKQWMFIVTFAVAAAIALLVVQTAYANPSFFANTTTTNNAASTSPKYMTPGTATSTLTHNALSQTFSGGNTWKTDFVTLLVQLNASSTNTSLNIAVEYSYDGIDWYRNFLVGGDQYGTSTTPYHLIDPFSHTMKFASSTVLGGVASSTLDRITAAITIPTPTQYTRLVFSLTGANGSVWAQIVPIKEQR